MYASQTPQYRSLKRRLDTSEELTVQLGGEVVSLQKQLESLQAKLDWYKARYPIPEPPGTPTPAAAAANADPLGEMTPEAPSTPPRSVPDADLPPTKPGGLGDMSPASYCTKIIVEDFRRRPSPRNSKRLLSLCTAVKHVESLDRKTKNHIFERQPTFETPYGVIAELSRMIDINRNKVFHEHKQKIRQRTTAKRLREQKILAFLLLEKNSYIRPDKASNPGENRSGIRILADTEVHLHRTYNKECEDDIKYGTFCRVLKKYERAFQKCKYIKRNVCLCITCANMSLLLQAVPTLPKSTSQIVSDEWSKEKVARTVRECKQKQFFFSQWKHVPVEATATADTPPSADTTATAPPPPAASTTADLTCSTTSARGKGTAQKKKGKPQKSAPKKASACRKTAAKKASGPVNTTSANTIPNEAQMMEEPSGEAGPAVDPETGKKVKQRKYHLDLVKGQTDKEGIIKLIFERYDSLRAHKKRVFHQAHATTTLRDKMPALTHVSIQVDYAENWNSKYLNEVSGHHWDRNAVTIHPMVVHVRIPDGEGGTHLVSLAYAGVSEIRQHSFPTTLCFLRKLFKKLKLLLPSLRHVHIVSDSPSSQYRNLYSCAWLREVEEEEGLTVTWNWLEAGHGKGPCDGELNALFYLRLFCLVKFASYYFFSLNLNADTCQVYGAVCG